jgi:hypothetical protein
MENITTLGKDRAVRRLTNGFRLYRLRKSLITKTIAGNGYESMFDQLDDPKLAGRKSWRERLVEGAIILAVSSAVIGVLVYALIAA